MKRTELAQTLILGILLLLWMITINAASAASGDFWATKAPMQQARGGLGVVTLNGAIYAIGGSKASGLYPSDLSGGFLGTNEEYNISANTWTYKSPMPTPRDYFATATYQNKIYCIGGHTGNAKDEYSGYTFVTSGINEVYDTSSDKWETKAPMPASGMNLQASVINGKILVAGAGLSYLYDPTKDSWSNSSALPFSSLYGGSPSFIAFTIGNETINTAVIHGAAAETSGVASPRRVYVMGLLRGIHPQKVNEVYDPSTDAWERGSTMPTRRWDFGLAVADDCIYAIGGFSQINANNYMEPTNANEQYIPFGYGTPDPTYVLETTPLKVDVLSPISQTYKESSFCINFTVNKPVALVYYSLDGKDNVTIKGNTTLTGLSDGMHNLTVYAMDTFGNTGTSETITFNVTAPFPTVPVAAASGVSVIVIVAAAIAYVRRRKR
jgi:hypothetical protein